MRRSFVYLLAIFFIGCASMHYSNYQPFLNVSPNKLSKLRPIEYEDCMQLLDTILVGGVKENFMNSNGTIATIEISKDIGWFLISSWELNWYGKSDVHLWQPRQNLPEKPIDLPSRFIHDGISDPNAMIRVIFNNYHKYLNGYDYDWEDEISKMKSVWVTQDSNEYYTKVPTSIAKTENKILVDYYFELLTVDDTVDILYNRPPRLSKKSSDWYYTTGVIQFKIAETKEINVELIDIKSELGNSFWIIDQDTIGIGDTLTDFSQGWLKRGYYYFNYYRNAEYRSGIE